MLTGGICPDDSSAALLFYDSSRVNSLLRQLNMVKIDATTKPPLNIYRCVFKVNFASQKYRSMVVAALTIKGKFT